MECYDKALLLNPSNCDAYVARGAARANQRQFKGAVQDFEAALQIDPDNSNAAKYLKVMPRTAGSRSLC
jgi:tetratricopeptide (TPR) repeat protein